MKEQSKKEGVDSSRSFFSNFHSKYLSKLNRRVFITLFLFIVLSLSVFGGIMYYVVMDSLQFQIQSGFEQAANSRLNHIITYFDEKTEMIKLITSRTQFRIDIHNYLNSPNSELYDVIVLKLEDSANSIKELKNLCFIDLDGIVIACSDNGFTGLDYSGQKFFNYGKIKEGAYFFNYQGHWDILISGPISQDGKLMGVIITLFEISEFEGIVKDKTGLGQTGEILIALKDESGQIVYPLTRLFENEAKTRSYSGLPMVAALNGESIFLDNSLDYRDVQVIAATKYFEDMNLGLVAKIDRSEAIGAVRSRLLYIFMLISFALISVLAVILLLISYSITKPIQDLTSLTERLKNNDYKVRADIKTGDEIQQLAESFNSTIERLENMDNERKQLDKAKTEFLSITSHELRSPMTPMRAQLQMVLGDYFGKLNSEQRSALEIVLSNTERLDKIIVDFLEISRIEAARLKFNFVKVDLTKTINYVIEEAKAFMPEKKIKIEAEIGKLPVIEVDPDRISQVLRNLLINAIKFSHQNGRVEVSAKLNDGMILFSVKDEGVGVTEKDQKHLFEPFFQVENMYQHKSGGTGLGLTICKGIVESQNGKIWFISKVGKGTVFYFTVPLTPVRDIGAIKILFSGGQKIDEQVKNLFIEYIGPLGEKEFELLKNSKEITYNSISEYISDLSRKGILLKENSEDFKSKVIKVFNRKRFIKKNKKEER